MEEPDESSKLPAPESPPEPVLDESQVPGDIFEQGGTYKNDAGATAEEDVAAEAPKDTAAGEPVDGVETAVEAAAAEPGTDVPQPETGNRQDAEKGISDGGSLRESLTSTTAEKIPRRSSLLQPSILERIPEKDKAEDAAATDYHYVTTSRGQRASSVDSSFEDSVGYDEGARRSSLSRFSHLDDQQRRHSSTSKKRASFSPSGVTGKRSTATKLVPVYEETKKPTLIFNEAGEDVTPRSLAKKYFAVRSQGSYTLERGGGGFGITPRESITSVYSSFSDPQQPLNIFSVGIQANSSSFQLAVEPSVQPSALAIQPSSTQLGQGSQMQLGRDSSTDRMSTSTVPEGSMFYARAVESAASADESVTRKSDLCRSSEGKLKEADLDKTVELLLVRSPVIWVYNKPGTMIQLDVDVPEVITEQNNTYKDLRLKNERKLLSKKLTSESYIDCGVNTFHAPKIAKKTQTFAHTFANAECMARPYEIYDANVAHGFLTMSEDDTAIETPAKRRSDTSMLSTENSFFSINEDDDEDDEHCEDDDDDENFVMKRKISERYKKQMGQKRMGAARRNAANMDSFDSDELNERASKANVSGSTVGVQAVAKSSELSSIIGHQEMGKVYPRGKIVADAMWIFQVLERSLLQTFSLKNQLEFCISEVPSITIKSHLRGAKHAGSKMLGSDIMDGKRRPISQDSFVPLNGRGSNLASEGSGLTIGRSLELGDSNRRTMTEDGGNGKKGSKHGRGKSILEKGSDDVKHADGDCRVLWIYSCRLTIDQNVSCLAWNPANKRLLAVGYCHYDYKSQSSQGTICLWSIKNPAFPERFYYTESGVTSVAFSNERPNLLVVGCYNGSVVVYDVSLRTTHTLLDSIGVEGRHLGPVWGVQWSNRYQKSEQENSMQSITSISADGQLKRWNVVINRLVPEKVYTLKRFPQAPTEEKIVKNDDISFAKYDVGLCFDFHIDDESMYLVGTEDGSILRCSTSNTEAYLNVYDAHKGPVYAVRWAPYHDKMFASCSADWTLKLWHVDHAKPIYNFFYKPEAVIDLCWSPFNSTVLASATDTTILIWNFQHSVVNPLFHIESPSAKIRRVQFSQLTSSCLVAGDSNGNVTVYKIAELPRPQEFEFPAMKKLLADGLASQV